MQKKICYWLNSNNVICKVDDFWDQNLKDPAAPRVREAEIINRSILDFVYDDATRMFLDTILQAARLLECPISRPYRCDGPSVKRYMKMTITREKDGILCVAHEMLRTEPLESPVLFKTIKLLEASSLLCCYVRCSICNRLRLIGESSWQEVDIIMPDIRPEQPLPIM